MKNFEVIINQRVIDAINCILEADKGLTKANLAESLGIKATKFSEILNKRMVAGMDVIQNLCILYRISAEWLILGEGNMYKTANTDDSAPNSDIIEAYKATIEAQQKTIRSLDRQIELLEDRLNDENRGGGEAATMAG